MKITRILNGVAQDISFIATKSEKISKLIFEEETIWQSDFRKSSSTLDVAIEYDLENEKNNLAYEKRFEQLEIKYIKACQELNVLKSDLFALRKELKYFILLLKIFKKLLYPVLNIMRYLIQRIMYLLNKIFNLIIKFEFIQKIFESELFQKSINLFLNKLIGDSSHSIIIKIKNNIDRFARNDSSSDKFNNMLRVYYRNSKMSKFYFNLLKKGKSRIRE